MTRVTRGNAGQKRHKKILQLTKGFKGAHSSLFRVANQRVLKSLCNSYRDRANRKRYFRSLWIIRLNGIIRSKFNGTYSKFIHTLRNKQIGLNRKMLAQLSFIDESIFEKLKMY
uniref:50S ribosomal protein L20 n=1 Tax=Gloeochaete wittrockiana TaxID=38269 RepID=A0A3G1IVY2_9EUKA|nr:ribosomal protein L20 [Gloeochaete wittrockiana]ASQ40200.1 ribosomal protein L20 [Gloeochaete wittrockiana]